MGTWVYLVYESSSSCMFPLNGGRDLVENSMEIKIFPESTLLHSFGFGIVYMLCIFKK